MFLDCSWNLKLHSYIPNLLLNVSKKTSFLLHSHDFRTRYQVLTCVFFPTITDTVWNVTMSQRRHRLQDPKDGLRDFHLKNVILELWRSNMSHSCTPHLSWSRQGRIQNQNDSNQLLWEPQCCIQSYFETGILAWDPKLRPSNSQKCKN